MKNLIIIFLSFISFASFGQKNKYTTETIKVYGVCDMCEKRIETAVDVVGVRSAEWDVKTNMLTIVYNPTKIAIQEIHQLCANVGHATDKVKADPQAYANLHGCCKYMDPKVQEEHNH